MRFAYIDSGGNEVPIPSVDALALRIELGAVGPDTQLYDAQADHWGPAHTHEIFHTLTRESDQEDFVPPPPPVPPPPTKAAPPAPSTKKAAPPATPKPPAKPAKPESSKAPEKKEPSAPEKLDLGLTLAAPPPEAPPGPAPGGPALDLSFELAAPPSRAEPDKGTSRAEPAGGTFDFGDLSDGLDFEESSLAPGTTPRRDDDGDLLFETPMQFTGAASATDDDDMGFGGAGSPGSGWSAAPGGSGAESVMDFSSAAAEAEPEPLLPAAAPAGPRRPTKDRPSPPKFKKQRSLSGPLVLGVLMLALGVGGYVGWPILSARLAEPEPAPVPVVVLPPIPAELEPRLRALTESAIADAVAEVAATAAGAAPVEPDAQWLRGNYLGNASQFGSIRTFWESIGAILQAVEAAEPQLFLDRIAARAQAEGMAADTIALLRERAVAEFDATTAARDDIYGRFDRLVAAALALHDFLVENDENIAYRPAAISTLDPVLEAVPSTPAIGDQMEARIGDYTRALDVAMGAIDRVSRERLTSALVTRLQRIPPPAP